jgi:hypothetical protein
VDRLSVPGGTLVVPNGVQLAGADPARELIARGPTLDPIDGTPSGSVHVIDLPDATAARAFGGRS